MTASKTKAKKKPTLPASAPSDKRTENSSVTIVLNCEAAEPIYVTHV